MKKGMLFILMLIVSIPGIVGQDFDNPLALQRADPWVHKAEDGTYYFIATAPEYDRIILRQSKTINGIKDADEQVIWTKHEKGAMSHHIWAPELHQVNGVWHIYFAASEVDNIWKIRMWVLSNDSKDPMKGTWKEEGQIITKTSSFSLDATTFEHKGKRYLIWAQDIPDGDSGTALVMSEMSGPTTLTGPEIILTRPEFNWERIKYNVNEGPAVIKRNGKIFVTYSASATNHNYCVGLLWIDENADLLDVQNWHKSPGPVFYSNEDVGRYGPGHNSFTTAEDGETVVMIYHARDYKEIDGFELEDPNRATRARVVRWTESGFPDFRQKVGD